MDHRSPSLGTGEGHTLHLAESDFAINRCMDGPILSYVHVLAWAIPISLLADQNLAGTDDFATEALNATALRLRVSAVTGGATGFLVCHSGGILQKDPLLASWFFGHNGRFLANFKVRSLHLP